MKTYVTYGFFMALGGFLLNLVLYLVGFHSDPAKIQMAQWIAMGGGTVIAFVCLVLGTKARRESVPPSEEFGYGRALGAGVMISLFASLFGIFTTYLYMTVINPGFTDILLQAQANNLEAKGISQDKIDQIQKMSAMWMKPAVQACFAFIFGMIFGTIFALITSAFLKRPATEVPPLPEEPPAVA